MSKAGMIWIVIAWVVLTLINYYYVPYFIAPIIWLVLTFTLFILTVVQVVKLTGQKSRLKVAEVMKLAVIFGLLVVTFYGSTDPVIEKADWLLFENKRTEIVNQVKNRKLSSGLSKLPFEFPVISNGENEIGISRYKDKITITFWIFRNFFEAPSTCFIYTDDPYEINAINRKIAEAPENNWKIKDNWYRTFGD